MPSNRTARPLFVLALIVCSGAALASAIEVTKDDVDFRKSVYVDKKGARLPYRLYVPHSYSDKQKFPLVLWLHGGTGNGSDNSKQLTQQDKLATHFWIADDVQSKFPAFVLVPQCPTDDTWSDPDSNIPGRSLLLTMDILAAVQKSYSIDPGRIYMAGQSRGGLGVWSLLQNYPEKWAGALVISAYDNFTDPGAIAQVPLWVFQGDEDQSVPVDMVRHMMKRLKKAHANFRYTEYHKKDHEAWTKAFAEPELLPWLSSQRRASPGKGQLGSGTASTNH